MCACPDRNRHRPDTNYYHDDAVGRSISVTFTVKERYDQNQQPHNAHDGGTESDSQ
jgi:hypothetical protein